MLVGLGVYVMSQANAWEYLGPDGPGPGFFPFWYGAALVALALLLTITTLVQRARGATGHINWGETGRALGAWCGLAVWAALLKPLGFLLAFGLFVFFMVGAMYRRPLLHAVVLAIGMSVAFYILFPVALNVALPTGILGF